MGALRKRWAQHFGEDQPLLEPIPIQQEGEGRKLLRLRSAHAASGEPDPDFGVFMLPAMPRRMSVSAMMFFML